MNSNGQADSDKDDVDYQQIPLDAPTEIFREIYQAVTERVNAQFASLDEMRSRSLATMGAVGTILAVFATLSISQKQSALQPLALLATVVALILLATVMAPARRLAREPRATLESLQTYANKEHQAVNYFYVYAARDKEKVWSVNRAAINVRLKLYSAGLATALFATVLWSCSLLHIHV